MLLHWCLCLWFAFLVGSFQLGVINGKQYPTCRHKGHSYKTIVVDHSGHGDFSSIQSAIDSVPQNNNNWVCIYIRPGVYREKVMIPYDKPYIILKGDGKRTTSIVWDDHETTAQSPTFMTSANYTVAKSITFVNSHNFPSSKNPVVPAVAALIGGDKSAFYRCGFAGMQDTLCDYKGRHYFKRCTIQGSVDFIFGDGQSIYEDCSLQVQGGGFITAQGRARPEDGSGFVFKRCKVFGQGSAYLGRPWRAYARVVFYRSNFSQVVDPRGWHSWGFLDHKERITYAEVENYGPGADTSKRVDWINKLSPQGINDLTSMSFIDEENWIDQIPIKMT